ncbi:MAG: hypothetical protein K6G75_08190 [Lachnospiraceae bacterium]|nr:hypothetical protein [Lachnospiraceae bacterium]
MNMLTDVTRKIILAGLGTIDEQNEEIKELLRRGSAVMGIGAVDNEELLYNGNREEIMKRRKEREREDNTLELGHGRSLYYNSQKDENGKVVERNIEYEKKPDDTSKITDFKSEVKKDGTRTVSLNTKNIDNDEISGGDGDDKK